MVEILRDIVMPSFTPCVDYGRFDSVDFAPDVSHGEYGYQASYQRNNDGDPFTLACG